MTGSARNLDDASSSLVRIPGKAGGTQVLLAVLLWMAPLLEAAEPAPGAGDYLVTTWNVDHGLPESDVADIIQTPDGYLWIYTWSLGLVRFDGVNFLHVDSKRIPGVGALTPGKLMLDHEGRLWVSDAKGALLARDNSGVALQHQSRMKSPSLVLSEPARLVFAGSDGRLAECRMRAGAAPEWRTWLPDGAAANAQYTADAEGSLWYRQTNGQLARIRGEQIEVFDEQAGLQGPVRLLVADPEQRLWVHAGSRLFRWETDGFHDWTPSNSPSSFEALRMAFSGDGNLWVETPGRLQRCRDRQWNLEAQGWDGKFGPDGSPVYIKGDAEGGAWYLHFGDGLIHVRPDGTVHRLTTRTGLSSDVVTCWFQDREGNIWVGSYRGGFTRIRERRFRTLGIAEGLPEDLVTSGCQDAQGAVWMGFFGGSVARWEDGQVTPFSLPLAGDRSRNVTTVADTRGRLWFGTSGNGVLVREAGAFRHPFPIRSVRLIARALLASHDGRIWIGNEHGLSCFETNQLKEVVRGLPVASMAEDAQGALWIGTWTGQLVRYENGQQRAFEPKDGVSPSSFWSLLMETNGTLWVGTREAGLLRFTGGTFARFTRSHGLPSASIPQIIDDTLGHLWLATPGGLLRVSKDELAARAGQPGKPVSLQNYGALDGLPTCDFSSGYQPACWRTADGGLWFPTRQGVLRVRPEEIKVNVLAPPVVVEQVRVDGTIRFHADEAAGAERNATQPSPPLRIEPGKHHLEFSFSGLSFTAPDKVRFRWKLEGLESEWVEGAGRRVAEYRYLPPGAYTFRVTACNNDGVWNEQGAELAFVLHPFFWERAWFKLSLGAVLLGTVAGSIHLRYRYKLRRRLAVMEQKIALERERTRIADDIHDEIGAKLSRISFLSDLARRELSPELAASRRMAEVTEAARAVIRTVGEIVWAVDPRNDSPSSLAFYVGRVAEEYFELTPIEVRCEFPAEFPVSQFSASVRHSLVCAVKEALNNILKHAEATQVRVAVNTDADFEVVIQDNGRGFPAGQMGGAGATPSRGASTRGRGLLTMEKRLRRVRGRCCIESQPGQGTRVRFTLPLHGGESS